MENGGELLNVIIDVSWEDITTYEQPEFGSLENDYDEVFFMFAN